MSKKRKPSTLIEWSYAWMDEDGTGQRCGRCSEPSWVIEYRAYMWQNNDEPQPVDVVLCPYCYTTAQSLGYLTGSKSP
jgi:hypothetical protein